MKETKPKEKQQKNTNLSTAMSIFSKDWYSELCYHLFTVDRNGYTFHQKLEWKHSKKLLKLIKRQTCFVAEAVQIRLEF